MLSALRRCFIKKPPAEAVATYIALVKAARNPFFYTTLAVPDTLDGRFELIVLHLFLLQHRLVSIEGGLTPPSPQERLTPAASSSREALRIPQTTDKAHQAFARALSEAFFNDMDRSLRELGVADTGVSHRIKKMGKAYHGRLQAYAAGLKDREALRGALARNLYGTVEQGDVALLDRFADYVERVSAQLVATDSSVILNGNYVWPDAASL